METTRAKLSRRIASLRSELGASLVEYALLVTLIAAVGIGAITVVGRETEQNYDCVALELGNAGISRLVEAKAHGDHWHALSPGEEDYAAACLDGVVFKPNPRP